MKQIKYLPYALLAILIVAFVIREMFHSKYSMKEALKLQSEQNRSNYLYKQLHESKDKEALFITERDQAHNLAGLYKRDIERLESFIEQYKAKLKQYEKLDRYNINRLTDAQLDSCLRARFPQPDSVVFSGEKAGGIKPQK